MMQFFQISAIASLAYTVTTTKGQNFQNKTQVVIKLSYSLSKRHWPENSPLTTKDTVDTWFLKCIFFLSITELNTGATCEAITHSAGMLACRMLAVVL